MAKMTPPCFIGIDGGGTGCRVAIADVDGTTLARAEGGPANYTSNPGATIENLLSALEVARRSAGLEDAQIAKAAAHLGLAGILGATDSTDLVRRMPMRHVGVSDDRLTSLVGALGARDGVLVSVGTGSFVAKQRQGARTYLGGWGFAIGDQASGAWLGRRLLERCVLVSDRLEPESDLTRMVLAEFDGDPERITRFAQQAGPPEYARYAPRITAGRSIRPASRLAEMSASVGVTSDPLVRISYSRPPMNRAEGTGSPKALTLISVSRAGSSVTSLPPMAMAMTHVPVETTENGALRASMCGRSDALESWIPQ